MTDMKTILGLALALLLWGALPAAAETVTFLGKAYCPIKYDINWPFVTKAKKTPVQGSGVQANVYELPKESFEEKSAAELGSDMRRLTILSAPIHVGQRVQEDEALITYELPLESLIVEKEALSRTELNNAERALSSVRFRLSWLESHQQDLENMASQQSAAPIDVSSNAKDISALLLEREYLTEELELAKQRYDNTLLIAHSKFGKNIDLKKLPRQGFVRSPTDGYVLWVNSSLVPGMSFTKQAALATVGKLDPILIRASVHEIAVQKLKVGDPATIIFHAWPKEPFQTTISKVDYVAQPAMLQQPSFYLIELTLPNHDMRIKEGMRCDVVVNLN
ncbi:efflux RND transporter periplasmic adaptor subunit [Desulfovibrio sp. TomC]|uniref:efflux RND transporter periplasmic adaptor subunit n=1 Tax=Desulfovibrio sp. TomC TaxID=1562888 RepID=UPI0005758D12|nr:efflux RND transporter periplasmic adaptor subunit [Desulfovibrio sp. TomC]KHK00640.1 multidrug resistance efflux pump-like protein [Desulfovibrio sp. TomC]